MSAQILKRAASPVPLSCILHIIAILFLAMLGGSYIGTESPEIETVVELAPDIAEEQQVTPEARPEQVIDNSFTAQIAQEVAENIVQKAAMADSTGNQALLSSDMAAVNGDGAVANGNGSSTAAYGGSSTSGSTDGENYSSIVIAVAVFQNVHRIHQLLLLDVGTDLAQHNAKEIQLLESQGFVGSHQHSAPLG